MGGAESNTDTVTSVLDAAAYDPTTNRWRALAPLPGVDDATVAGLQFAWTGSELLVWELVEANRRNPRRRRTPARRVRPQGRRVGGSVPPSDGRRTATSVAPIWTGNEIISPAITPLCDLPDGAQNCGPPPTNLHGSMSIPRPAHGDQCPTVRPTTVRARACGSERPGSRERRGDRSGDFRHFTVVPAGTAAAWSLHTRRGPSCRARYAGARYLDCDLGTGREILVWDGAGGPRYGLGPATTPTTAPPTTTTAAIVQPKKIAAATTGHSQRRRSRSVASFPGVRASVRSDTGHRTTRPTTAARSRGPAPRSTTAQYLSSIRPAGASVRGPKGAVDRIPLGVRGSRSTRRAAFDAQHRLIVAGLLQLHGLCE